MYVSINAQTRREAVLKAESAAISRGYDRKSLRVELGGLTATGSTYRIMSDCPDSHIVLRAIKEAMES